VIWGIDLGVRSAYLAGLNDGDLLFMEEILVPLKPVRSLELDVLVTRALEFVDPLDDVFVETPPLAGPRNIGTFGHLNQTLGAVLAGIGGREVNVMSWKKDVVGKGNATKDEVAAWLRDKHPRFHTMAGGNQNLVDATCIALYGEQLITRADAL